VGPERLPGAIRTGSAWLNRFRRGFNDLKREVQQELHNDAVMQELRKTGEQLKSETENLKKDIQETTESVSQSVSEVMPPQPTDDTGESRKP
jgi:sec-independent protein translocase protein TatB